MDKILILAGGYSNEREISLITAESVTKELEKNRKYRLLTIGFLKVLPLVLILVG